MACVEADSWTVGDKGVVLPFRVDAGIGDDQGAIVFDGLRAQCDAPGEVLPDGSDDGLDDLEVFRDQGDGG
jgi:hypothetical protein